MSARFYSSTTRIDRHLPWRKRVRKRQPSTQTQIVTVADKEAKEVSFTFKAT